MIVYALLHPNQTLSQY